MRNQFTSKTTVALLHAINRYSLAILPAIVRCKVSQKSDSYQKLHKPSSTFQSREDYLNHELQIIAPKRWRLNLPGRDYRLEWEDCVPGMAATIGKIVMVAAVVGAFAAPLGLSAEFVVENNINGQMPRP